MAISIEWQTRIITVPTADLTFNGNDPQGRPIYTHDIDAFRLELKDLEDSEEGMAFPDTHSHVTELVLGGVTYARSVQIINSYLVLYEDGQYAVLLDGANNNVLDVALVNQVSIRPNNSAGLIVAGGSGATPEEIRDAVWQHLIETGYSAEQLFRLVAAASAGKLSGAGTGTISIRDMNDTIDRIIANTDGVGNRNTVTHDVS